MALPGLLDAEGGLRLARERRADRAQLGGAAQHAVDKEAVHDDADGADGRGMADDEIVGHRAGEAAVPALADRAAADGRDRRRLRRSTVCGSMPPSGRSSCISALLTFAKALHCDVSVPIGAASRYAPQFALTVAIWCIAAKYRLKSSACGTPICEKRMANKVLTQLLCGICRSMQTAYSGTVDLQTPPDRPRP